MSKKRVLKEKNLNDENIKIKRIKSISEPLNKEDSKILHNIKEPNDQQEIESNYFSNLPVELKVFILKKLNYTDLSNLAIVSKSYRDIIIHHFLLNTEHLTNLFNLITNCKNDENLTELSNSFGFLIKKATFVIPISGRIKLIIDLFKNIELKNKLRNIYETNTSTFKYFTKAIKCIIAAVIRGWKFKEVLKLYDELELYFDNSNLIKTFLVEEFGVIRSEEQYLRYIYRRIMFESFFDNLSRAKWLNYFLNYHSTITSCPHQKLTYQAKLLLLLFAPIFQDDSGVIHIDWFVFSNRILINEGMEYIGFALKLLNNLKKKHKPDVLGLFNSITNIGIFWLYENSTALLLYAGLDMIKQIINGLLKIENYLTLTRYLTNLFIVESKLIHFEKIDPNEKITSQVYDYLVNHSNLNSFVVDNILELITLEFISIAKEAEEMLFDREYLNITELIVAQQNYYDLRLKKNGLSSLVGDKDFFLKLIKKTRS